MLIFGIEPIELEFALAEDVMQMQDPKHPVVTVDDGQNRDFMSLHNGEGIECRCLRKCMQG